MKKVISKDGTTITYDPSRPATAVPPPSPAALRVQELGRRLEPAGLKAMEAYRAANKGASPSNPEALLPYFATPQDGADFVEYLEAQKSARGN